MIDIFCCSLLNFHAIQMWKTYWSCILITDIRKMARKFFPFPFCHLFTFNLQHLYFYNLASSCNGQIDEETALFTQKYTMILLSLNIVIHLPSYKKLRLLTACNSLYFISQSSWLKISILATLTPFSYLQWIWHLYFFSVSIDFLDVPLTHIVIKLIAFLVRLSHALEKRWSTLGTIYHQVTVSYIVGMHLDVLLLVKYARKSIWARLFMQNSWHICVPYISYASFRLLAF